ncbi:MAG: AAA family ATPase [Bacteroidia bacterium]
MFKEIHLTNFFSFQEGEIKLEADVNLLIGINGSGKSNLFKALDLLRSGMKGGLAEIIRDWGGFDNIYCKCPGETEHPNSIGLKFILDKNFLSRFNYYFQDDIEYTIILRKKPSFDNYDIVEWVNSIKDNGQDFTLLSFQHGCGWIYEKKTKSEEVEEEFEQYGSGNWHRVNYDDKEPEELVLSTIDDSDRYPALTALAKALRSIDVYNYFNTKTDSPLRTSIKATGEEKLQREGENLFPVLNTLDIKHPRVFDQLKDHLNIINEQFIDLKFQQFGSGVFQAYLKEKNLNSAIHAAQVSDGTLKFLCLLAILLNPSRGAVIFIDEPEKGLHPDMLREIASIILNSAKESQIIIATHSPQLLNFFKVRNIRVFEKDEENKTIIKTYNEEDFKEWYNEFAPGNLWEKGELGGVRF